MTQSPLTPRAISNGTSQGHFERDLPRAKLQANLEAGRAALQFSKGAGIYERRRRTTPLPQEVYQKRRWHETWSAIKSTSAPSCPIFAALFELVRPSQSFLRSD